MINILICDDDIKITEQVFTLINKYQTQYGIEFNIDIKHTGDFILDNNKSYDIALVDIEMPGISGLKLSQKLKENNSDIIIVILTLFSDYLDSAMEIEVFRYLSKPIDINRFYRNFSDALIHFRNISKKIIIEEDDSVYNVKTKDILYIENKKHGSIIVSKYKTFITNVKPNEWYERINQPNCFIFSHKSYLVNLQNVINFNKNTITMQGRDETIDVFCISQRKYSKFKKSFYDFTGGLND